MVFIIWLNSKCKLLWILLKKMTVLRRLMQRLAFIKFLFRSLKYPKNNKPVFNAFLFNNNTNQGAKTTCRLFVFPYWWGKLPHTQWAKTCKTTSTADNFKKVKQNKQTKKNINFHRHNLDTKQQHFYPHFWNTDNLKSQRDHKSWQTAVWEHLKGEVTSWQQLADSGPSNHLCHPDNSVKCVSYSVLSNKYFRQRL